MVNDRDHAFTMEHTGTSTSVEPIAASATITTQHPITTPIVMGIAPGSRPSPFMEGAAAAEALLLGLAEDPLGVALATGEPVAENAQVERESPGLTLMEQALTWPVTGPLALPTGNAMPSRNPLPSGRALTSGIESSVPTAPEQCSLGMNSAGTGTDNLTSVVAWARAVQWIARTP